MKKVLLLFALVCLPVIASGQTGQLDYIRRIVREDSLVQKEIRFDKDGMFMPMRGVMQTFTHRTFNRLPGPFAKADRHWGDWGVALSPLVATWTLKALGVKSRSTTQRMLMATGTGLGLTVGLSQVLKWSVSEERPDGTDRSALPSMHAAVAFMGATMLNREYGHISPWIAIGGYTAATGSQMLRIAHNAHWMNDIFLGAGIGVVSTNVAYWLTDCMLGAKGVNRMAESPSELHQLRAAEYRPSGFRLFTGTETCGRSMAAEDVAQAADAFSPDGVTLRTSASITSGAEAEWFFSDYLSLSVQGRMTITQAKLETADRAVTAFGEQIYTYHGSASLCGSMPLPRHRRIGARAIAGVRYNESKTFCKAEPGSRYGTPLLTVPGQVRPVAGAGIVIDMLQKHNHTVGFSFDFLHTFNTKFMPDRWVLGSSWKAMF